MFRWISKLIVATVLITLISVATTWFVVSLYVEEIFRQYQLPALGKKVQFSDFTSRLVAELNIVKPRDGGKEAGGAVPHATEGASPSPTPAPSAPEASTAPEADAAAQSDAAAGGIAEEEAVPVWGRAEQQESGHTRELVISTEDFSKKKESLTSEDKMKIFSLVVAKLPQNEVQRLSALLEEGITAEELKEVDQTLRKYLKEEEYKELLEILNKY